MLHHLCMGLGRVCSARLVRIECGWVCCVSNLGLEWSELDASPWRCHRGRLRDGQCGVQGGIVLVRRGGLGRGRGAVGAAQAGAGGGLVGRVVLGVLAQVVAGAGGVLLLVVVVLGNQRLGRLCVQHLTVLLKIATSALRSCPCAEALAAGCEWLVQSWALSVFFNFFTNKKLIYCIFIKLIT